MSKQNIPMPLVDVKPVEVPVYEDKTKEKKGWLGDFFTNTAQDFSDTSAQIEASKASPDSGPAIDLNALFSKNAQNSKTTKLLYTLLGFMVVMFLLFFAVKFSRK